MKMRWFLAGLAALLITGGGATVAQRVITQKTRGVLPEKDDPAHPETRAAETVAVRLVEPRPALGATPPAFKAEHAEVALTLPTPPEPPGAPPLTEPAPAEVIATTVVVAEPTPQAQIPAGDAPSLPPTDGAVSPAAVASPQPAVPDSTPTPTSVPTATVPPAEPTTKSDPVDAVETFVERNRKEAETAIENLTAEAANLKERLAKVETALARWQTFSRALNADQPAAQTEPPPAHKPNWKRSATESAARPAQDSPLEESPRPTVEPTKPAIESLPEPTKTELPANPPLPTPAEVPEAKPATPEPTPRPSTGPPAELPPPQG